MERRGRAIREACGCVRMRRGRVPSGRSVLECREAGRVFWRVSRGTWLAHAPVPLMEQLIPDACPPMSPASGDPVTTVEAAPSSTASRMLVRQFRLRVIAGPDAGTVHASQGARVVI